MDTLEFSTGVKTFSVNGGAAEVTFNPTDVNFVSRLYDLFLALAEQYEAGRDRTFDDNQAFFAYVRERDGETRAGVDGLFGPGTADALFQGVSTSALADGLPLWTNFLLAVIDAVPEEMSRQVRTAKPRVEKYLKKYHR